MPPLSHRLGEGANLYYPIPYSKSLKVTVDALNDANPRSLYYHVNYRTYNEGTKVKSFSLGSVKDAASLAEKIAKFLQSPTIQRRTTDVSRNEMLTINPGAIGTISLGEGNSEIRLLRLHVNPASENALRQILFLADFDGESCISAPLGDFFGSAPGLMPYSSLPMSISSDGWMESRWVMPQRNSGKLYFRNYANEQINISCEIVSSPIRWNPQRMHFKAKWKHETMPTRPMRDWNYLTASGMGRYVGSALFVTNPTSDWWGEGDEKVYVDSEAFPSTFGTGTEDYYGYAWCSPTLFSNAYHNQLRCDGPGNRGYTALNRFHIFDDLPWRKTFKFDIEVWHWKDTMVDFAQVAYWYQLPSGTDNFSAPMRSALAFVPVPPPMRVAGAVEGETMAILQKSGGTTEVQQLGEDWSDFKQIWWRDGKPGDVLIFEVPAPADGDYELSGKFCTAVDYAIVQLRWNGQPLGQPIDFYNKGVKLREHNFGKVHARRLNKLEVEIIGSNKDAVQRYMFGIDYVLLKPISSSAR